ncbi:centrosomal protein of 55 kDa isoform X2 [Microcaecilia unicolor]|uniref:Centrosomal protein of 55 kDa n=1 Tax=Microcaecilia unicolor TaxID=1415580 RepID=A0A6P7XZ86_9AMPH|nr:centrosomal protein of 55 kDa-like isoform X2 [Microcaecilia unicolor]
MTSKGANGIISNQLGIKSGASKLDTDLEKLWKENAALKKTMEKVTKGNGKVTDSERNRFLEKILVLETLKEKNSQQLAEKDKEIQRLKSQPNVEALRCHLEEKTQEAEKREQLYKSLSKETESLKKQLFEITDKCKELENRDPACQASQGTSLSTESSGDLNALGDQLKDALEKNQQWQVYDQQREVFVKGLMTRIFELEQQSRNTKQIQQDQLNEARSGGRSEEEKQKYYDKLLINAKQYLEAERKTTAELSSELTEWKKRYEEKKKEVMGLNIQLQSHQDGSRQHREEERKHLVDKVQKLKMELEISRERLEEEKKRASDFSSQVQVLQKSLLKQQEEQKKTVILEKQIKMFTSDFENEKRDHQKVQHQLYKVLKELRKAKEQITRLEAMNSPNATIETFGYLLQMTRQIQKKYLLYISH